MWFGCHVERITELAGSWNNASGNGRVEWSLEKAVTPPEEKSYSKMPSHRVSLAVVIVLCHLLPVPDTTANHTWCSARHWLFQYLAVTQVEPSVCFSARRPTPRGVCGVLRRERDKAFLVNKLCKHTQICTPLYRYANCNLIKVGGGKVKMYKHHYE